MSERVNWSEEHLDARLNVSHYNGVEAGIEQVVKWLRTKSGEAFAHGNDSLAQMLRSTSDEIKKDILKLAATRSKDCADRLAEVEVEDAESGTTSQRAR